MLVYKVSFQNGKVYIGQTIQSRAVRKKQHFHNRKYKYKISAFNSALNKYGFESTQWEVIDTASSIQELDFKEQYWIEFYKSTDRQFGYNLKTGGSVKSLWSKESKDKLSKAKKGKRYLSDEHYRRIGELYKERPWFTNHTDEAKLKMSLAKLEKKRSRAAILKGSKGTVYAYNAKTLEFIGKFETASECARSLNLNVGHICSIIRGNTRLVTHKGLTFRKEKL